MNQVIDMQVMRYLNLFNRITKIKCKSCFHYNNGLIFAVPYLFLSRAIGEKADNLRKLSVAFGKKIRIVAIPRGLGDAQKFIKIIISPIEFNEIKINNNLIEISADMQNRASLFGRNKTRFNELSRILKEVFNKELRIV